jgi:uncharacterized protein YuzB (UPF0349 family)
LLACVWGANVRDAAPQDDQLILRDALSGTLSWCEACSSSDMALLANDLLAIESGENWDFIDDLNTYDS